MLQGKSSAEILQCLGYNGPEEVVHRANISLLVLSNPLSASQTSLDDAPASSLGADGPSASHADAELPSNSTPLFVASGVSAAVAIPLGPGQGISGIDPRQPCIMPHGHGTPSQPGFEVSAPLQIGADASDMHAAAQKAHQASAQMSDRSHPSSASSHLQFGSRQQADSSSSPVASGEALLDDRAAAAEAALSRRESSTQVSSAMSSGAGQPAPTTAEERLAMLKSALSRTLMSASVLWFRLLRQTAFFDSWIPSEAAQQ